MTQTSMALALAGFSFLMTVIWGPPLIRLLRYFKIGKLIRVDGPERHFSKLGTPTMGGLMIIAPITLITLLLNAASLVGNEVLGASVFLPLGVMLGFAVIGAIDDWAGLRGQREEKGLSATRKIYHAMGHRFCGSLWFVSRFKRTPFILAGF